MTKPCVCENGAQQTFKYEKPPYTQFHGDGWDACIKCREVVSLETEIMEMQAALACKFERRRELMAELNQDHSPINQLMPPEIMSSIFKFCLPEQLEKRLGDGHDIETSVPLILGAVCQIWRDIAWSTPELWQQIYISIITTKVSQQNELARQWLSRSGRLPLKICTDLELEELLEFNEVFMFTSKIYSPIIKTINRYSSRWQELHLYLPAQMIRQLRARSKAPRLRTVFVKVLVIRCFDDAAKDHNVPLIPGKPTNVRLNLEELMDYDYRELRIDRVPTKCNWNVVTHLELKYVPLALCIDILKQASGLTHLDISEDCNGASGIQISHPRIRCLKYSVIHYEFTPLPEIHFPALEELHCCFSLRPSAAAADKDIEWICALLQRSSRVQKLYLKTACPMPRDLIIVMKATPPTVQYLSLSMELFVDNPYTTIGEVSKFLAKTSFPGTESGPTRSISPLPNLLSLTYIVHNSVPVDAVEFEWNDVLGVFGPLPEMNNPLRRPLKSLDILCAAIPIINRNTALKAIELRHAGIHIAIRHQKTGTDVLQVAIENLNDNNSNGT